MSNPFIPIEKAGLTWSYGLPFSNIFNEAYCNTNSLVENERVFIAGNRLINRWTNLTEKQSSFVIAETGFGFGLNFLLSWSLWLKHAPQTARLHFISCEQFPLTKSELIACLNLWPELQEQALALVENYPVLTPGFHHLQLEQGRVHLTLMLGDASACYRQLIHCGDLELEQQIRSRHVDAWFLNGFSPEKNPSEWSMDLCQAIALLSRPGTTLATNTVVPFVKENLQAVGFQIAFEQDRMVAEFSIAKRCHLKLRTTPWHLGNKRSFARKKAIVLGAGLAGCYTAQALAKRGWQITLIDALDSVGQGASGNRQAVLYPQFSAYRSPLTVFMLSAFLFARRLYGHLIKNQFIGDLSGILQLAYSAKEQALQQNLGQWLAAYPTLGRLVDAREASAIAGVDVETGGLFIPDSGWIDSQALCQLLIQTSGIHWVPRKSITELIFNQDLWHAGEYSAEVLVIANGYKSTQFTQTAHLPLKTIRGQMTMIASNDCSQKIKVPLCGEGNILPEYNGLHAVGASYHLNSRDTNNLDADDSSNLAKLAKLSPSLDCAHEIISSWSGIRTATTDYLPLVGPVPDSEAFKERFSSLSTNAKRWIPTVGPYHPGLFICAGFGSRGLSTIPLSAEWLAASINNEFNVMPDHMMRSISPSRFLFKELIKK